MSQSPMLQKFFETDDNGVWFQVTQQLGLNFVIEIRTKNFVVDEDQVGFLESVKCGF